MAATYIHVCYRIMDPEKTTDFYVNKLGMQKGGRDALLRCDQLLLRHGARPSSPMLELTHNHGQTEPYDKGNGYSHIAFTVDDLEGTVARLQEGGVKLTVEPKTVAVDGHDYRIAFVEDPDGYRVELVERGTMKVGDMIQ
ncbi:MAG TPA: VOC family protein [Rubrobacter sp.]|nr:VOC family protein [Rubrobacter sp.]